MNPGQQSKCFGIGLSRTGTKSLAVALNLLGIRTKWYPQDYDTYRDLVLANYRLRILEQYDGLTDTPVAPYYPQFDTHFPGSKFILTVRDKDAWLQSCRKHWEKFRIEEPEPDDAPHVRKFAQWIDCVVYGSRRFDADRWSWVYDRHVDNVKHYFRDRPEDLLVIDFPRGGGWPELCAFLGKAPPDQPFPKINDFHAPLLG